MTPRSWLPLLATIVPPLPAPEHRYSHTVEFTLWRPLLPYGYSYKASCARPGYVVICNFWHPGTLTLSPERQSAQMSKITNDDVTRSGTGCFIAMTTYTITCDNSGHQRVNKQSWMCLLRVLYGSILEVLKRLNAIWSLLSWRWTWNLPTSSQSSTKPKWKCKQRFCCDTSWLLSLIDCL